LDASRQSKRYITSSKQQSNLKSKDLMLSKKKLHLHRTSTKKSIHRGGKVDRIGIHGNGSGESIDENIHKEEHANNIGTISIAPESISSAGSFNSEKIDPETKHGNHSDHNSNSSDSIGNNENNSNTTSNSNSNSNKEEEEEEKEERKMIHNDYHDSKLSKKPHLTIDSSNDKERGVLSKWSSFLCQEQVESDEEEIDTEAGMDSSFPSDSSHREQKDPMEARCIAVPQTFAFKDNHPMHAGAIMSQLYGHNCMNHTIVYWKFFNPGTRTFLKLSNGKLQIIGSRRIQLLIEALPNQCKFVTANLYVQKNDSFEMIDKCTRCKENGIPNVFCVLPRRGREYDSPWITFRITCTSTAKHWKGSAFWIGAEFISDPDDIKNSIKVFSPPIYVQSKVKSKDLKKNSFIIVNNHVNDIPTKTTTTNTTTITTTANKTNNNNSKEACRAFCNIFNVNNYVSSFELDQNRESDNRNHTDNNINNNASVISSLSTASNPTAIAMNGYVGGSSTPLFSPVTLGSNVKTTFPVLSANLRRSLGNSGALESFLPVLHQLMQQHQHSAHLLIPSASFPSTSPTSLTLSPTENDRLNMDHRRE